MSLGSPIIFLNEDADSYYQSYTDGVFVGSPRPSFASSEWGRVRLGSKTVASSSAWEESLLLSVYVEGGNKNAEIYGGTARIVKGFNNAVFYTDSIAPEIVKIFTTGSFGSGSLCRPTDEASAFFDVLGNDVNCSAFFSTNGYLTASTSTQRISNIEWQFAFPFEKKYQQLDRGDVFATETMFGSLDDLFFKPYSTSAVVDRGNTNIAFVSGSLADSQLGIKTYQFFVERSRTSAIGSFVDILPTKNSIDSSFSAKVVFGIQPNPASTTTYAAASGDTYIFASGAFVEGWRYGLSSGIQSNPYFVFLPDRFGQPYHMLHSSLQSALMPATGSSTFSGDTGPLGVNGGVVFISGSALPGEQDMWLTASIYSGSNVAAAYAVNPKCSGIYDRYCRSGMPWFDNDARLTA